MRYHSEDCRARVAEIASRILNGDVRPLLGARMLLPYIHQLEKEIDWEIASLIIGVNSETDAIPLGEERQYWAGEALHEKGRLADSYEERIGPAIVKAAKALLILFPPESSS